MENGEVVMAWNEVEFHLDCLCVSRHVVVLNHSVAL